MEGECFLPLKSNSKLTVIELLILLAPLNEIIAINLGLITR